MKTVKLTMGQALVRYLIAQRTIIDGDEVPLFAGLFGIFGHGNVTCIAEALEPVQDQLPTWRGQNEQSMALAAIAYAKAKKRRQIMIALSSIGPGATNMVTAAGVAMSNRLPVLLLAGDTFANRIPDPVLQQVEHFGCPSTTANDAFRSVTRYWDRIVRPEQILGSLPQAVATMLDPADCGPAFLGLAQDAQAEAYDYPEVFFEPTVHEIPRPRPDVGSVKAAVEILRGAEKPLIIAGGGVQYSGATAELAAFAEAHNVPVCETIGGRTSLLHDHPMNIGPIGVIGSASANAMAAEADVVFAVGTRLGDFITGSWTVFREDARIIALNAARFDAVKHRAVSVIGDALVGLEEIDQGLANWRAPDSWIAKGAKEYAEWNTLVDKLSGPTNAEVPSYAHVVGALNRMADPTDLALSAAGGLPGEVCKVWKGKSVGTYDCEFGFSCMGYEIAGAWGAKMANPDRDVIAMVGDGSYLMMNSDIYSTVLTGDKVIFVVMDNGGFAVINRLQNYKGGKSFNNMFVDTRRKELVEVDFAKHAESMGALSETVHSISELEQAFARAKAADRTYVIVTKVQAHEWTPGDAWWDVGVPEVNEREEIRAARVDHEAARGKQRVGV
ncbi:3D-(3,5/4)-trihydroxycyclohexane-1,2-dione acylhydrolase (decyclizing) [Bauldia sp.]|uniref:3D-(3,5/4)-trihydroxycyclohexane-1,2-dione acylhydrolase (decyclizing) n=1 Tax=Bauldia sp. TaxID=2575872 RepID=UPI003BAD8B5D